jgi:hypothetical protein
MAGIKCTPLLAFLLIISTVVLGISTVIFALLYFLNVDAPHSTHGEVTYVLYSGTDTGGKRIYIGLDYTNKAIETFSPGFGVYKVAKETLNTSEITATFDQTTVTFYPKVRCNTGPCHTTNYDAILVMNSNLASAFTILMTYAVMDELGTTIALASGQT